MGACTKLKWSRQEGRSIDSLFCPGLLSVDAYYRYLKEYDSITRSGMRPKVAVGVIRYGVLDYEWTEKFEIEPNPDTYVMGTCQNFGCPTEHDLMEMCRSSDNRKIEKLRRVKFTGINVGCLSFGGFDEVIDHLTSQLEDCDG